MNLRSREAWKVAINPKTGEPVKDVIETHDGTFTICQSWSDKKPVFIAWRRRVKPQSPDLVGGYPTADAARDACARYFDRMQGRLTA